MRGIQAIAAQEGTSLGRSAWEGLVFSQQGEFFGCSPGRATTGWLDFRAAIHDRFVVCHQEPLSALCTQNSGSDLYHASLAQRAAAPSGHVLRSAGLSLQD